MSQLLYAQGKVSRNTHPTGKAKTSTINQSSVSGQINGHDYVDLGLPSGTKWATCNVGANNPWDFGDYYAWGEITTKSTFSPDNCKTLNKKIDINDSEYNIAIKKMGKQWTIPNEDNINELIKNCKWEYKNIGGIYGYKVTGPNSKSIFLPCAGGYSNKGIKGKNEVGIYWCYNWYDSVDFGDLVDWTFSRCFIFDKDHQPETTTFERWLGFTIRPVSK